jgi:hypothetical protein
VYIHAQHDSAIKYSEEQIPRDPRLPNKRKIMYPNMHVSQEVQRKRVAYMAGNAVHTKFSFESVTTLYHIGQLDLNWIIILI